MHKILMMLWELPQTVFGWVLVNLWGAVAMDWIAEDGRVVKLWRAHYAPKWFPGVSLGSAYIIFPLEFFENIRWRVVYHEMGHQVQSRRLGWFYLITVGVVSGFFNLVARMKPTNKLYQLMLRFAGTKNWREGSPYLRSINYWYATYYLRWPESEADVLGGA